MHPSAERTTDRADGRAFRYTPERRTALVLCGTGAHGAYHAGVLRALHEAGVKIDVMAGQGVGAVAAALAAVDGAPRLWDEPGLWRGAAARRLYRWRRPLRVARWLLVALAGLVLGALVAGAAAPGSPAFPWLFAGAAAVFGGLVLALTWPSAQGGETGSTRRRRAAGRRLWRLLGAPLDPEPAREATARLLWDLLRGGSTVERPTRSALGRRYAEVLADSLGQPGFRELMVVITDLDSRRDVIAALLSEPHRTAFTGPRSGEERGAEIVDLSGTGRDHAFDAVAAALTPGIACDPYLLTFGVDSYWRGETHRFCDRPGSCIRLLEELAAAGVSQAIVVSAVAAPPLPHRLASQRLEPRHRLGEFLMSAESASLRDARELARLRFDSVYIIAPVHNPIGPFDFAGAYDEASDRHSTLAELMERGAEDAYRQFIEPIVGASGDHLAHAQSLGSDAYR